MSEEKKNKVKATFGTIIFHILVIAALLFLGLSTPLPLPGEEGVEVNLGSSNVGMGNQQAEAPAPKAVPKPKPQPVVEEKVKEDIITQDIEEAPVIEEKKEEKKEKVKKEEEPYIEDKTDDKVEKEPEPEPPKVDPRALYKGKSQSDEGQDEGITGDQGDQGKENGDPDVDNYDGLGGAGEGVSFDLGGRGKVTLTKPPYKTNEEADVRVTIHVDKQGIVKRVQVSQKGTTTSNPILIKEALNAARHSTFQADPNAPDLQKGTITYKFRKKG